MKGRGEFEGRGGGDENLEKRVTVDRESRSSGNAFDSIVANAIAQNKLRKKVICIMIIWCRLGHESVTSNDIAQLQSPASTFFRAEVLAERS